MSDEVTWEFYFEVIEHVRTTFFENSRLVVMIALKKSSGVKSKSDRFIILPLNQIEEQKRLLKKHFGNWKHIIINLKGTKYMEDVTANFALFISDRQFQLNSELAGKDGDIKLVESMALRILMSRYFIRCNENLRMGSFTMDQKNGKIGMKIGFDLSLQMGRLDPRNSKETLETFLRTMISTASHGWTFHMYRILYMINDIDMNTYLSLYSHISHRKLKLEKDRIEIVKALEHLIEKRGVDRRFEAKADQPASQAQVVSKVELYDSRTFENSLFPKEIMQVVCSFDMQGRKINETQVNEGDMYKKWINEWIQTKASTWTGCSVTCIQVYFGGFAFVAIFEYKRSSSDDAGLRRLAVKMSKPNDTKADRIKSEVQALQSFEKKGILNSGFARYYLIVNNKEPNKHFYDRIFMDAYSGHTVDMIGRYYMYTSLTTILTMTTYIIKAIKDLITHDCVHNDLKPTNILISRAWIPKIIDFGEVSTKEAGASKKPGFTVPYVPPENLQDSGAPEQKDKLRSGDIFSFGVILFEMLFGIYPFDYPKFPKEEAKRTLKEVNYKFKIPIHHARLYGPQDVMEELMLLCYRCVEGEPNMRPTIDEISDFVAKCLAQIEQMY